MDKIKDSMKDSVKNLGVLTAIFIFCMTVNYLFNGGRWSNIKEYLRRKMIKSRDGDKKKEETKENKMDKTYEGEGTDSEVTTIIQKSLEKDQPVDVIVLEERDKIDKSLDKENKMDKACIGSTRTGSATWYCPKGKSVQECTYCEFCIKNGCIPLDDVYPVYANLNNCNCDCPQRNSHPQLEALRCTNCKGGMFEMATMSRCRHCKCEISSCSNKYCVGCSIILNKCESCDKEIKNN